VSLRSLLALYTCRILTDCYYFRTFEDIFVFVSTLELRMARTKLTTRPIEGFVLSLCFLC